MPHTARDRRGSAAGVVPDVLVLEKVAKSYGSTQALTAVDLRLRPGTCLGLVGENGAGKSTLVRILSGVTTPDSGALLVGGAEVSLDSPASARRAGVSTVFQELTLIPSLSVAENVALQSGGTWRRSSKARAKEAVALAARWGIAGLDPDVKVGVLSLRDRQILEILCAVDRPHSLLILDEPTSSLLPEDTRWLREITRRRVDDGAAVLFISHMLDEVEDFCDEVAVQRNGGIVALHRSPGLDRAALVEQMIGRSLDAAFPDRTPRPVDAPVTLQTHGLTVGDAVRDVDLAVHAGEIVGIAALDGQGQAELFSALAGDVRPTSGTIQVRGRTVRHGSPRSAIRSGISFVPADRKTSGTVLALSVRKNISLPVLDRSSRAGIINDRKERTAVEALMDLVDLQRERLDHSVRSLSGGNQQKVAFARACVSGSPALLLYDPTRGVDVGTKYELYKLIQQVAAEGTAVLLYSTEIPEIVNLAHRALAWYGGRIVRELDGSTLSEHDLMSAAIGLEEVA